MPISHPNSYSRSLIIALFTLLGSILLGKVGYFMPFLITGSIIMTIGSGLIYSLDIGSSAGEYIGYQVITGVGTGLAVQVPVIVAQSLSATEDVSTATATMLCTYHPPFPFSIHTSHTISLAVFQFLSAAIGVGTATSIFNNRLIESLPIHAPTVEVVNVLAVGATGLREAFPSEQLPGVLRSYMIGLKDAWLMGLGFAAVTLITAFLPEWKSIKKPKADTKVDAEAGKRNSAIGDAVKDAAKRNSAIVAVV